ncbi:MAG TPA: hypothetical protein VGW57_17820 [Chthoniobacterales bacterium]|nr:hypothetical protein [Chthoniobacterales bacterium]
MRATALVILIVVRTGVSQIVFDDGKPPTKGRSLELEALNFMTGRWISEYVLRETPESNAFTGKGTSVIQWSPNGQFLISDQWLLVKSPGPPPNFWGAKLAVTTWDPVKKEYCITEVWSGGTQTMSMALEGKKMITRGESRKGDHVTKTTSYAERISDTQIKVRIECSIDDGPTWVFSEGTATKVSN